MVRPLRFCHRGTGSIPGRETKIPHATALPKKKKSELDENEDYGQ